MCTDSFCSPTFFLVPAQPSGFEAEAEPDTTITLKWLWPVQEPITLYELHYWEDGSENKVRRRCQICTQTAHLWYSV